MTDRPEDRTWGQTPPPSKRIEAEDGTVIPQAIWVPLLERVLYRIMRDAPQAPKPIIRFGWPQEEEGRIVINLEHFEPGSPPIITVCGLGIFVADETGMTVYQYDGSRFHKGLDGKVESNAAHVERIEVHDITQLTSHQITRVFDTSSHVLKFLGGGSYSFLMDAGGRVVETHAQHMCLHIDTKNIVHLYGDSFPKDFQNGEPPDA
jgi:hypothetical protein